MINPIEMMKQFEGCDERFATAAQRIRQLEGKIARVQKVITRLRNPDAPLCGKLVHRADLAAELEECLKGDR